MTGRNKVDVAKEQLRGSKEGAELSQLEERCTNKKQEY